MTDHSGTQYVELTQEEKMLLMRGCKRIAELYDECTNDPHDISGPHRERGPDPLYKRTRNGLFLEFYYGGPYRLWTPWGSWLFAGAAPDVTNIPAFMSQLTLWMYEGEERYPDGNFVKPVYGIQAIESQELPAAVCVDNDQLYDVAVIREEWKRLYVSC
ncbi:MAG TPA: hypothetical protein VFT59_04835 [Candidatus Saccharimonadales bacterium]|nr:hypothetical protein [Candidatus Saccharimonadales bacterium]